MAAAMRRPARDSTQERDTCNGDANGPSDHWLSDLRVCTLAPALRAAGKDTLTKLPTPSRNPTVKIAVDEE
jgi:hypothetical protein